MGSLKVTADKAAKTIFSAFKDYIRLVNYSSKDEVTAEEYDPSGTFKQKNVLTLENVKMVVTNFREDEIDGDKVQYRDLKCYVRRVSIASVLPIKTTDSVIVRGLPDFNTIQEFDIKNHVSLPSVANPTFYQIQLRAS